MRLKHEDLYEPQDYSIRPHRRFPRKIARIAAGFAFFGLSGLVAAQMLELPAEIAVTVARGPAAVLPPARVAPARAAAAPVITPLRQASLLDPAYVQDVAPAAFGRSVGLRAQFASRASLAAAAAPQPPRIEIALAETDAPVAAIAAISPPVPSPRPADLAAAPSFPAPPPRPVELSIVSKAQPKPDLKPEAKPEPKPAPPLRTARATPAAPAQPAPAADGGSFLAKLFGGGSSDPAGPALAYASPQDGAVRDYSAGSTSGRAGYDRYTAIYDISARTVTLPNGTRLEAHSGLGEYLDDPRAVHLRMRGATPPALYDLREREALFHGVRAIRLTPINSSVHGRAGLLAHTYMLGPNGQSNGCVSFRNYDAFLQAYLRGDVKRLAVVAKL